MTMRALLVGGLFASLCVVWASDQAREAAAATQTPPGAVPSPGGSPAASTYVGSTVCAQCHFNKFESYQLLREAVGNALKFTPGQAHVFDRFWQATKASGWGSPRTVHAKAIVEGHGGTIGVREDRHWITSCHPPQPNQRGMAGP